LALLAVIGCNGCSHEVLPWPGTISADGDWTEAELAMVNGSLEEWSYATGGSADIRLAPGSDWRIILDTEPMPGTMGVTMPGFRKVWIFRAEISTEAEFATTVLHELGHAYGIREHARDGLMQLRPGTFGCIDSDTLAELCSVRTCAEQRPTCLSTRPAAVQ
jgi:hypothetical protein